MGDRVIDVLLVTSDGCHFCEEASAMLEDLAKGFPLRIGTVPLASAEGTALLVRHRAPFPPILLIDGLLFGFGRISRRKLQRHLTTLVGDRLGV